jgi:hypothetical protein
VTPLTSVEIDKTLRADLYYKSGFLGVFPRDKIPLIKFYPACFVLNTDPSYKIGEHWLGINLTIIESVFSLTHFVIHQNILILIDI